MLVERTALPDSTFYSVWYLAALSAVSVLRSSTLPHPRRGCERQYEPSEAHHTPGPQSVFHNNYRKKQRQTDIDRLTEDHRAKRN